MEIKAETVVVIEATKQNGFANRLASGALKSDKEAVLEAMKQNGLALWFAFEALKADNEVVHEAVKSSQPPRCTMRSRKLP